MNNKNLLFCILLSILLISCNSNKLFNKKNNTSNVEIKNLPVNSFTNENIDILKRYFLGNPAWNYSEERGKIYAVKKKLLNNKLITPSADIFIADSLQFFQNRVIISFDKYLAYTDFDNTTFVNSSVKNKKLFTFSDLNFQNFIASYLVIEGKYINIEIFELGKTINRTFTQQSINNLRDELNAVLENSATISEKGKFNNSEFYPINYDSIFFDISECQDSGKYILKSAYNFNEAGKAYCKVFETKYGNQLSKKQITPASTKLVGWAETGTEFFYYESEIVIYEGAFSEPFEARFELWFVNNSGNEAKIFEKNKIIKGWTRKN